MTDQKLFDEEHYTKIGRQIRLRQVSVGYH